MKNYFVLFVALVLLLSSLAVAKPNIAKLSNPVPDYNCAYLWWTEPSASQGSWIRDDGQPRPATVYGWNTANGVCVTWKDQSFSVDGTVFLGEQAYALPCQNVNYPMKCPAQFQSIQIVNTQIGFADWKTEVKLKGTEASFHTYTLSACDWSCDADDEITVQVEKECSQF